jgi:hypothetical protein
MSLVQKLFGDGSLAKIDGRCDSVRQLSDRSILFLALGKVGCLISQSSWGLMPNVAMMPKLQRHAGLSIW